GVVCSAAVYTQRPELETRQQVEAALAEVRKRTPAIPLVKADEARKLVGDAWPKDRELPNWVTLLVNFPRAGLSRVASYRAAEEHGNLDDKLKVQIMWIAA